MRMNVYFDYRNLVSFIHSFNNNKNRFNDCERMLEENFNIILTFPQERINDNMDDEDDIKSWLSRLYNYGGSLIWDSEFPQNPFNINDLFGRNHLRSVYCLDSENRDQVIRESGLVLFANVGSELEILSSLLIDSNQYTCDIFDNIHRWEDLRKYASPCSDIIIVDQYIFSSPELYEYNIFKLIQLLTENARGRMFNIVIITSRELYDKKTRRTFRPDFNAIYNHIKDNPNHHGFPKVTFVTVSGGKIEHDRTLFTNYKIFSSGDSYVYFDSQGNKITRGRWMHVHSLASVRYLEKANDFLADIQKFINNIIQINNDLIIGDRVSNYLLFT